METHCPSCTFDCLVTDGREVRCLNCKAEFDYSEIVEESTSEASEQTSRAVLLSIDPEWATAILASEKRWEYRRRPPAQDPPFPMLLYATSPVSAVVGDTTVGEVKDEEVDRLVNQTIEETPHSPLEVLEYFDGRETGSALRITDRRRFPRKVGLDELGVATAPQNFQYLGGKS